MAEIIETPGKITISRPTYGDGRKKIVIRVEDAKSGTSFLEVEMEYADFAEALTGMGNVPCELEARGLDVVGKQCQREQIQLEVNWHSYSNDLPDYVWEEALKEVEVDGWVVSRYLGSRNSIILGNNDPKRGELEPTIINTYKIRYV